MTTKLYCFYDMAVSPCSYDFFTFLYAAETCRLHRYLDEIHLVIIHGPDEFFRKDSIRTAIQNETFFHNVITPGISLLPSCKSFQWCSRDDISDEWLSDFQVFPRGYQINKPVADYTGRSLVAAKIRRDLIGGFVAPRYAEQMLNNFLENKIDHQQYITLTTREIERDDINGTRTIDLSIWQEFSEELEKRNIKLLILRDTDRAFQNKLLNEKTTEVPEASIHLPLRMAIYQNALINFSKNNGPGILQLFSANNNVYFNQFDNNVVALSEKWFAQNYGMTEGSQFPMTRVCNVFEWKPESLDTILGHLERAVSQQKNTNANYSFHSQSNTLRSIEVALQILCKNICGNVLNEDLALFQSIDKLLKTITSTPSAIELLESQISISIDKKTFDEFNLKTISSVAI